MTRNTLHLRRTPHTSKYFSYLCVAKQKEKGMINTVYGKVSTNELKPTFDDPEVQARYIEDLKVTFARMSDERFQKHWNLRLQNDDPQVVDLIYQEYAMRYGNH